VTAPHAHDCPAADRLVADAIRAIGAEIDALAIPRLGGVVLGGGYGRGEGGVFDADGAAPRLSNDLDFYVVAEDGATPADLARIAAALRPVSEKWTARLGVDVDFSPPKTPWRLKHDEERLMIQELVHGYFDVAGRPGEELFRGVERREPSALPAMEAVRLLVNRGAGLLLASAPGASPDFIARNINKAILGCGDARLIARGGYRWRAEERAEALGDPLYSAAVAWKFRPRPEPVCDWEKARDLWLDAAAAGGAPALRARSLRAALRWVARRRTLGPPRTLGMDPLVRILDEMLPAVRDRRPFAPSLRRDWEIFN
jgi:hypothetical protein